MAQLTNANHKVSASVMLVLSLAALAWAILGLLFPVQLTAIDSTTDDGKPYHTEFFLYGFNDVGSLIIVLAGAAITGIARSRFIGRSSVNSNFWPIFAVTLVVSAYFIGDTPIISWSSSIPPEVLHAIGTQYANVQNMPIANIPLLVAQALIIAYALLTLVAALIKPASEHDERAGGL